MGCGGFGGWLCPICDTLWGTVKYAMSTTTRTQATAAALAVGDASSVHHLICVAVEGDMAQPGLGKIKYSDEKVSLLVPHLAAAAIRCRRMLTAGRC
jgi:hypothetical protein